MPLSPPWFFLLIEKKLGDDLNTSVGQEMRQAIESAKDVDASVHYIDRDVQVTFKRIWGNLTFLRKSHFFPHFFLVSLKMIMFPRPMWKI